MESSAYYAKLKAEYKKKIDDFKAIREKVSSLTGFVTPCQDDVKATQVYVDQIVIMGESMDKGALGSDVLGNLEKVSQNIDSIIDECDELIQKYTDKYNEADRNYNLALQEEEAARRAAEQAKQANDLKSV